MDKRRRLDGGEGEPPGYRREGGPEAEGREAGLGVNCSPTGRNS